MTKQIMVRAWEIARAGANGFGGKASEYFQESLVIAWGMYKNNALKSNRIEVTQDDSQVGEIVIYKNNIVVHTIRKVRADKVMEYAVDSISNFGVKTLDFFLMTDNKRAYRGQRVAS